MEVSLKVGCLPNTVGKQPVAYLWFRKGGPNFRWLLVLIQREGQPSFPIFFQCQQKFFFGQKGAMAQWPPLNTPLEAAFMINRGRKWTLRWWWWWGMNEMKNELLWGIEWTPTCISSWAMRWWSSARTCECSASRIFDIISSSCF